MYHSIVTVEMRKKPTNLPQCHRCQRYGHTKNYCTLALRCVKCAGNHSHTECTKQPNVKLTCANCGGDHAASYRGCSHHKELQQRRMKNRPIIHNSRVNPIQTFADRVNNVLNPSFLPTTTTATQQTESSQVSNIIKIIIDLITPFLPQIKTFITTTLLPLFLNGP